ncbi:serine hydrolase domain-containing protein [Spirosoma fluviale]|uniref:CubicO group peptidase, beta-lactamase class C family n=1 Tax=Spirosoma fluviale TaxID=1597977 RepID=A0A286F645_9BACT|nr:serine hydrolase domain-containing protein [Spirosoma fluviale]SOD78586.1 CubicO group peptidase, beta-lactamase class C family [Spirosoma fluviale]
MKLITMTGLMAGFFMAAAVQTSMAQTVQSGTVLKEAAAETVGMSTARLQRMDAVINDYIAKGRQAGVGVMVSRNGRIVYYKAYGLDNIQTKAPLKRDAIFRIASQTKAIASIGLMLLFEEGKFLLDDPISKYIPAFKNPKVLDKFNEKDSSFTTVPAKREITIRQLLTHTSGIGYPVIGSKEAVAIYAKNKIPSGIGTPGGSLADAMNRLGTLPLLHQPGEKFTYGLSVDVVGYLIEVLSGQSLDQFLRTRLFDPLGMNDTYFYLPESKKGRLTMVFTEDSVKSVKPIAVLNGLSGDYPKQAGTFYSGGAGLSSTMYDYAIFLQMMLNGGEYGGKRFLSPTTVRLITTNQIGDLGGGDFKFGLGFSITSNKGASRLPVSEGTFEWGGYFGTTYWADPKEGIVAQIYTQKTPNSFGDLTDKFKVLVYQAITQMK